MFDKIVSIKDVGIEQVYDIEVEGTHNFIGNGIVAHNTYTEQKQGARNKKQDARNKKQKARSKMQKPDEAKFGFGGEDKDASWGAKEFVEYVNKMIIKFPNGKLDSKYKVVDDELCRIHPEIMFLWYTVNLADRVFRWVEKGSLVDTVSIKSTFADYIFQYDCIFKADKVNQKHLEELFNGLKVIRNEEGIFLVSDRLGVRIKVQEKTSRFEFVSFQSGETPLQWWQGRSLIQIDPNNKQYCFVLKHGGFEELSQEANIMLDLKKKGCMGIPEPIPNERGEFVYSSGEDFVLRYHADINKLQYLTDLKNYPPSNTTENNREKLLNASVLNMKELGNLFKLGYVHTSLTELSHHYDGSGRWLWDYDDDFNTNGEIAGIESAFQYPNFRMGGIADFEHVKPFGLEDIGHHLGQNFVELILCVGYVGIKIGLSDSEIAKIIQKSVEEFSNSFCSLKIPEEFLSGLNFFISQYRENIDKNRTTTPMHKPLLKGIRTLINCYKETDFFKLYVPYCYKYDTVTCSGEKINANQDGVSLFHDHIVESKEDNESAYIEIFDPLTKQHLDTYLLRNKWIGSVAFSNDRIFVVNRACCKVDSLDQNGRFLKSFDRSFVSPNGITVIGEKVYVSDLSSENIFVFDLDGNFLFSFGGYGQERGKFNMPMHLFNFNGRLIVIESGNNRIQVFDKNGKFINIWGTSDENKLEFPNLGIVLLGHLLILDKNNTRVQIFNKDGSLVKTICSNTMIEFNPGVYIRYIDHRPAHPYIQVMRPAKLSLHATLPKKDAPKLLPTIAVVCLLAVVAVFAISGVGWCRELVQITHGAVGAAGAVGGTGAVGAAGAAGAMATTGATAAGVGTTATAVMANLASGVTHGAGLQIAYLLSGLSVGVGGLLAMTIGAIISSVKEIKFPVKKLPVEGKAVPSVHISRTFIKNIFAKLINKKLNKEAQEFNDICCMFDSVIQYDPVRNIIVVDDKALSRFKELLSLADPSINLEKLEEGFTWEIILYKYFQHECKLHEDNRDTNLAYNFLIDNHEFGKFGKKTTEEFNLSLPQNYDDKNIVPFTYLLYTKFWLSKVFPHLDRELFGLQIFDEFNGRMLESLEGSIISDNQYFLSLLTEEERKYTQLGHNYNPQQHKNQEDVIKVILETTGSMPFTPKSSISMNSRFTLNPKGHILLQCAAGYYLGKEFGESFNANRINMFLNKTKYCREFDFSVLKDDSTDLQKAKQQFKGNVVKQLKELVLPDYLQEPFKKILKEGPFGREDNYPADKVLVDSVAQDCIDKNIELILDCLENKILWGTMNNMGKLNYITFGAGLAFCYLREERTFVILGNETLLKQFRSVGELTIPGSEGHFQLQENIERAFWAKIDVIQPELESIENILSKEPTIDSEEIRNRTDRVGEELGKINGKIGVSNPWFGTAFLINVVLRAIYGKELNLPVNVVKKPSFNFWDKAVLVLLLAVGFVIAMSGAGWCGELAQIIHGAAGAAGAVGGTGAVGAAGAAGAMATTGATTAGVGTTATAALANIASGVTHGAGLQITHLLSGLSLGGFFAMTVETKKTNVKPEDGLCLTPDSRIYVVTAGGRTVRSPVKPTASEVRSPKSKVNVFDIRHRTSDIGHRTPLDESPTSIRCSTKPLINIKKGDFVLSLNEQTQKLEPHRVMAVLNMGTKPVYKIRTASGKELKTTLNHPYLVRGAEVRGERREDGEAEEREERRGESGESLTLLTPNLHSLSSAVLSSNIQPLIPAVWKKLRDIKVGDEIATTEIGNGKREIGNRKQRTGREIATVANLLTEDLLTESLLKEHKKSSYNSPELTYNKNKSPPNDFCFGTRNFSTEFFNLKLKSRFCFFNSVFYPFFCGFIDKFCQSISSTFAKFFPQYTRHCNCCHFSSFLPPYHSTIFYLDINHTINKVICQGLKQRLSDEFVGREKGERRSLPADGLMAGEKGEFRRNDLFVGSSAFCLLPSAYSHWKKLRDIKVGDEIATTNNSTQFFQNNILQNPVGRHLLLVGDVLNGFPLFFTDINHNLMLRFGKPDRNGLGLGKIFGRIMLVPERCRFPVIFKFWDFVLFILHILPPLTIIFLLAFRHWSRSDDINYAFRFIADHYKQISSGIALSINNIQTVFGFSADWLIIACLLNFLRSNIVSANVVNIPIIPVNGRYTHGVLLLNIVPLLYHKGTQKSTELNNPKTDMGSGLQTNQQFLLKKFKEFHYMVQNQQGI